MAKLPQSTTKYIIEAQIEAEGVVEKPDVIGAIFGQTEGLLGTDLELRELQKTGRIGRIEVDINSSDGKSSGTITIPSSLDASETALIAAALETIERIGPCTAAIKSVKVEDVRIGKRKYVMDRAKNILKELVDSSTPSETLTEKIKEEVRTSEITDYQGLPCGPDAFADDSIIIVEGRADVLNLLKNDIKNAVAIEGTSIPEAIKDLAKEKIVTAFLDGDRGGELILKELLQLTEVDFIAFAPRGKEVEELTKKEIHKALREKTPTDQLKLESKQEKRLEEEKIEPTREAQRFSESPAFKPENRRFPEKQIRISQKEFQMFKDALNELVGTRAACVYDANFELLGRIPSKELTNSIRAVKPYAIIFDGKIDQLLVNVAEQAGVRYLVGMEKERIRRTGIVVLSKNNLGMK